MRCNGSNWAVYSPGSWDGFRNDLWALWAGVIMRLEHHLVGGYVRYISPHIIIIIKQLSWFCSYPDLCMKRCILRAFSGKLGCREVKTSALLSRRLWVWIPPESPVKFFHRHSESSEYAVLCTRRCLAKSNRLFITRRKNFINLYISQNPLLYRILDGQSSSGKLGGREVKTSALVSRRLSVRITPELPVEFFSRTQGQNLLFFHLPISCPCKNKIVALYKIKLRLGGGFLFSRFSFSSLISLQ